MRKFLFVLLGLMSLLVQVAGKVYYVAPDGDDTNDGLTLLTPLKTIKKAASIALAGDSVLVRAGVYRETITPLKSGTAGAPITFMPYPGEQVIISGTERLSGWTLFEGNIYKIVLPSTFLSQVHNQSDQVFVDGQMMPLARWPNNSALNPSYPEKSKFSTFVSKKTVGNVTTGVFTDKTLPAIDITGAGIYIQPNYNAWSWTFSGTVTAVSGTQLTFTSFNGSGKDGNSAVYDPKSRYYLYNKRSLLDAPGEWYHDMQNNTLYLWCPGNAHPDSLSVEAKKREFAFNLSNRSWIIVKGFRLFACTITTDDASGGSNKGYDASGNVIYPWRGAGSVAASSNCIIDSIDASYLTHFTDVSGHFFMQWGQSSGMVISGRDQILRNCRIRYSAGNGVSLIGERNRIENNYISDVDYLAVDCSGINTGGAATTVDHEVAYNTINRCGRHGVTPREMGNSVSTGFKARIHHNEIMNFMLQDWDGGGIYTGGNVRMLRIDHNVIHDATGYTVGGVYIDWGKNAIIDHNVVYNVEWPIHLQEDESNSNVSNYLVYNNTLVVNAQTGGYGPFGIANVNCPNGNLFQNNISVFRRGDTKTPPSGYLSIKDEAAATCIANLKHPVDPLFVSFAEGRLAVMEGSPAISAGVPLGEETRDEYVVPPFNDSIVDTLDVGAYEYGIPVWKAGTGAWDPVTVAPPVPAGLRATDISENAFTLAWELPGPVPEGLKFELYMNGAFYTGTRDTSLILSGLKAGTKYSITLAATDAWGNTSAKSPALAVTTMASAVPERIKNDDVLIFPNPAMAGQLLEFRMPQEINGELTVSILKSNGQETERITVHANQDSNGMLVMEAPSEPGFYLLTIKCKDREYQSRLLVK